MSLRTPRSTLTYTLFPYTTLFRSAYEPSFPLFSLLALYNTHILLESNVLETVDDLRVHVVDSASIDGVEVQVEAVGSNEYASSTSVGKIELVDSTREGKSSCSRGDSVERDEGDYRSEEHTSELQSLMRHSYAVFCLKKNKS